MKRRIVKKKIRNGVNAVVDTYLKDKRFAVGLTENGLVVSIVFPDAGYKEKRQFKSRAVHAMLSLDDKSCLLFTIPLIPNIYNTDDLMDLMKYINECNACHDSVALLNMIFTIQEIVDFFHSRKNKTPNLITLALMAQLLTGNDNVDAMDIEAAFTYYQDKTVALNTKLALIDLTHMDKFRKALRILIKSGHFVRSIFNTIWPRAKFKAVLSKPENGSFSYLPILSSDYRIL